MVNLIIASHGDFAKGILMSGSMIFGEQENVEVVTFLPNEGPDDLDQHYQEALSKFNNDDEVLFLVDLWGGSPFNRASLIQKQNPDKMAIVSGLNLPMLIEAYGGRLSQTKAADLAKYLVPVAREGVKSVPEFQEAAPAASKEKSTVGLKEGHINIKLARLDTRLLHGQVATAWTPDSKANRIIVVSDAVAKDELRKSLIQQAAPNGVKANIVPISKMIEVAKDDRFGGVDAFLLFETVEDVLRAVEGGVPLKSLNVGSMAHSEGKTMVNKVLSMDKTDVAAFEKLRDLGVEFDVRKVPNDSKSNLFDLIKKANVK
ncbi:MULTISPECIES: mannose/fructose/sorbose PTS transporter subunit IIA [Leuconostoc]|uniref:PTS system mannose-specific EIIAB component n=1 Tax=Leuconostoc pseudomesenteroides TaxID=33968 RepID=A0A5B8SXS8_LEUPS|nr:MULTISPECIES: mannose/fructose/sorbose PTS transporter subunit IIA [Leuconostoc]MCC7669309.1 PTS mannose transporter subunit IIAB [Leuconostoc pseudomesenteroides]MCC8440770.1 PTS mannose transporter subunit IIAB [Leuconostoc pseudomesenteroides]MDG9734117.1 mannose/fructose/sorbose PTS transporter subunit IIA [Leuconostoc pseudomesenteroides]MDN2451464.1 PTS mannose transporter subunit IIAB [Leuconostoc sp. UCMA20149]NKZ35354.1 PTS mannose transporter subunit IIAB [Leuconostoc pseudomesent